ncbi:hypothetical protein [Paraburkholderia solitsugae]|nr:hypothetical protein [Paraburkholderia solitsugae]
MNTHSHVKVAILDDYQNVSLSLADWSPLDGRASISGSMITSPIPMP